MSPKILKSSRLLHTMSERRSDRMAEICIMMLRCGAFVSLVISEDLGEVKM